MKIVKTYQYTDRQPFPLAQRRVCYTVYRGSDRKPAERFEKIEKKLKKGVDKGGLQWYYSQAHLRAPNLENDTE